GKLPVSLPELYPYGYGLEIPKRPMTLAAGRPEDVGFQAAGLAAVDDAIESAISRKAFPGAVVAIGKDGVLVHLKAFGKLSYDANAAPVAPEPLYDVPN